MTRAEQVAREKYPVNDPAVLTALGWIVTIAMFAALAGLAITSFGS